MIQVWQQPRANILAWPYGWQTPVITEQHAYARICASFPAARHAAYVGFPWATLIDLIEQKQTDKAAPFLEALRNVPADVFRNRITVCQHIFAMKYRHLFQMAGITDLFWSHASIGQTDAGCLRVHPFPLYPAQFAARESQTEHGDLPLEKRTFLYSFVGLGAHPGYLTAVRSWIAALPPRQDAIVQTRDEWHYHHAVYAQQILGEAAETGQAGQLAQQAAAYRRILGDSVFSLCPSGTGPNSIRLWESLGYGCIPVILADTLQLPGDIALWRQASVFVKEEQSAVSRLPQRLAELANDRAELLRKQRAVHALWERYGMDGFTCDIDQWVTKGGDRQSLLGQANRALEEGRFRDALELYEQTSHAYPALTRFFERNIARAKAGLRLQ
jgi:hypothetical protein